jgi:hypothetical protein
MLNQQALEVQVSSRLNQKELEVQGNMKKKKMMMMEKEKATKKKNLIQEGLSFVSFQGEGQRYRERDPRGRAF